MIVSESESLADEAYAVLERIRYIKDSFGAVPDVITKQGIEVALVKIDELRKLLEGKNFIRQYWQGLLTEAENCLHLVLRMIEYELPNKSIVKHEFETAEEKVEKILSNLEVVGHYRKTA